MSSFVEEIEYPNPLETDSENISGESCILKHFYTDYRHILPDSDSE